MLFHLTLDCYGCDREALENEPLVNQMLVDYPEILAMERVSPAHVYYIEPNNPADAGYSGFVIIAESHVAVHTWPEFGEVNLDICSCKEFDVEKATQYAIDIFKASGVESNFLVRATQSKRPPSAASNGNGTRPVGMVGSLADSANGPAR